MTHMSMPLKKLSMKAPNIPSVVFLGEIPYANGLFPYNLPNKRPPLSAYHVKQNVTIKYFGLKY